MELNLEQFNPKKAELVALANKYEGLFIKGIDDRAGQQAVYSARIELKNTRIRLTKAGKAMREDAVAFSKRVIELEKELVGIIEPIELRLEGMELAIEKERVAIRREKELKIQEALNARVFALGKVGFLDITASELQAMDDTSFDGLLAEKTEAFEERQKAIAEKEKQDAIQKGLEEAERARFAEEQLIGVDVAYFGAIIEILRWKEIHEMTSSYLNAIIDRVFNKDDSDTEETI